MNINFNQFLVLLHMFYICVAVDLFDISDDLLNGNIVKKLTSEEKLKIRLNTIEKLASLNSLKFEDFCKEHGLSKLLNDPESKKNFEMKKDKVQQCNEDFGNGKSTVVCKLGSKTLNNKKPGLLVKDFVKQTKRTKRFTGSLPCKVSIPSNFTLPLNFTWRTLYDFPVKDQGESSACWATSAASSLEYFSYRYFNNTESPSVQQGCDCSAYADCNFGGFMTDYFDMCMETGATSEPIYPYLGQTSKCKLTSSMSRVIQTTTFRSYCYASTTSEAQLAYLVQNFGPVTVAIYSSSDIFHLYAGGIITPKQCNLGDVDHAILIVGFGTDPITGLPYWECKNSWGTKWGEAGYFRMQRGVNSCNMMTCPEALLFLRP